MPNQYHELLFTDAVKTIQAEAGSRDMYARQETIETTRNADLGPDELAFIAAQDSFYMASVSQSGWPYVQHRGGPRGFLVPLGGNTLAFADFSGNHQYITTGNLADNQRVAIILTDYTIQRRIKLLAHAEVVSNPGAELLAKLTTSQYPAPVERVIRLQVQAFEWNCPKHITQRYSLADVQKATAGLQNRIAELEAALAAANGKG